MKKMPYTGITAGLALVILSLISYFISASKSPTAFIPCGIAIPLIITSLISLKSQYLKLGMHIAATFGLLGLIAPTGMLISKAAKGTFEWKLSTYSMLGMGAICLVFTLLCVKSFIDVRKARQKS